MLTRIRFRSRFRNPIVTGSPPVPVVPGPLDRLLPAVDSLTTGNTVYGLVNTSLIVRIIARNNSNALTGLALTVDGVAPTDTRIVQDDISGHPVAYFGAWKGLTPGNKTIAWTCSGSAGFAAMRIGDVVTYDSIGGEASSIGAGGLIDVQFTAQAPGAGDLSQQSGWMDDRSYPATQYYGAVEQWQTSQQTVGPELLANGDFSAPGSWTLGLGWSIGSGVASHTSSAGMIEQAIALTPGGRYYSNYSISSRSAGATTSIWRTTGGTIAAGPSRASVGSYSAVITAPASVTGWGVNTGGGAVLAIDNASLKQITSGMTAWFARQVTPASGQLTYEAANYNDNMWGVALAVEIKGLVLP